MALMHKQVRSLLLSQGALEVVGGAVAWLECNVGASRPF